MRENGEEVSWTAGEHRGDDILYSEESDGWQVVDVVVGIDVVEVICVSVVMEFVGVLDWWLWSDVEGAESVDVGD